MTDAQTVARVRQFTFERFLADAQAPVVEELMTKFSLSRDEVTAARAARPESGTAYEADRSMP